ncbi:Resolvase domain protein [Novosphingobium sp. Rr 2-17]|uniref:recombinase family protein n=1 Tax=Novosphingobium sp. Rr 2-17 TaxID=555793 RepID=UPI0002698BAC|nr:recombinase family protein [Novosphingobium sp. Rr 2-17]EIZ79243.1 Resolvase domain protein [Novosphingobium sp. Rr 2-17]
MTKAYSYVRFSTPAQLKGDSLRRQLGKSEKFAAKHGLSLDTSLQDLGLSAFKGAHRHKGALGSFLAKIEAGEIERGSYLIVENLDRLSREQVLDALTLFLSIINAGVVVVTLNDDMIYSQQSIADRPNDLIISIGGMIKGNRESVDKAERLQEVWQEKRDDLGGRRKLTRQGPGWLDLVPDDPSIPLVGVWRFNECAAVVRQIFELCIAGRGCENITRHLNAQRVPSFKHGDGWSASTVRLLLTDRRTIGELQLHTKVGGPRRPVGDPIKGYFANEDGETVVSEETYYLAQAEISKRWSGARAGKKGKVPNLLVGVARCQCGRKMEFRDKSSRNRSGDKSVFLICSGAQRRRACDNRHHFTYLQTESLILDWVSDITMTDDEASRAGVATIKLAAKIAERDDLKRRVREGLEKWATSTVPVIKDSLMATAERDGKTLERVEVEVMELERLANIGKRSVIDDRRSVVRNLRGNLNGLTGDDLFAMRAKLAAALRQVVNRAEFHPDGSFGITLTGGLKLYTFADGAFVASYDLSEANPDGQDKLLTFPQGETIDALNLHPMTLSGIRETLVAFVKDSPGA